MVGKKASRKVMKGKSKSLEASLLHFIHSIRFGLVLLFMLRFRLTARLCRAVFN